MDRQDLLRTLNSLRSERTEAEHQLAMLQRRVDALRKAADGMEDLLASDEASPAWGNSATVQVSVETAVESDEPLVVLKSPHAHVKDPSGGQAALTVLKTDPSRFWTVREVWDDQVKRGWAADTKDARAAVRVALVRLAQRDPAVERLDGPTSAYRWTPSSPSHNASVQAAGTEQATGVAPSSR